jgi:DNA polymerase III alpha subunit
VKVRYVGKRKTRDIEVASEEHNFFANGIVVSNSHAFSYSAITGAELFLKYHFFVEYMTAIINHAKTAALKPGEIAPHVKYINYVRKMDRKVLNPSVNKSDSEFTIEDGKIRYALAHIKHLGKSAKIIQENRPYVSFQDFFDRLPKRTVNKRVINNLIYAGAFDEFGDRNELIFQYAKLRKDKELPPELTEEQLHKKEEEVIGICLSRVPILFQYKDMIKEKKWATIGNINQRTGNAFLFCRVQSAVSKTSKKGNQMKLVTVTDDVDSLSFYVFDSGVGAFERSAKIGGIYAIPLDKFEDGNTRFFNTRKEIEKVDTSKIKRIKKAVVIKEDEDVE